MIISLHSVLSELGLQHHELGSVGNDGSILLVAKTHDPEGITEVMRIKNLADKFNMNVKWDGHNIEIRR